MVTLCMLLLRLVQALADIEQVQASLTQHLAAFHSKKHRIGELSYDMIVSYDCLYYTICT